MLDFDLYGQEEDGDGDGSEIWVCEEWTMVVKGDRATLSYGETALPGVYRQNGYLHAIYWAEFLAEALDMLEVCSLQEVKRLTGTTFDQLEVDDAAVIARLAAHVVHERLPQPDELQRILEPAGAASWAKNGF